MRRIKGYEDIREKLILSLDVDDAAIAYDLIDKLAPHVKYYKVGLQLITKDGPRMVMTLKRKGLKVFYDAKFFDIPQTVYNACYEAVRLGVNMVNVHALGGPAMIKSAKQALEKGAAKMQFKRPLLLAVTVLTSMQKTDLRKNMRTNVGVKNMVLYLARQAKKAGADGVVCSPKEISLIKKNLGKDFVVVTPGIRTGKIAKDDQKRVMTPEKAVKSGADYIVVGRPILQAKDKQEAVHKILKQISGGAENG